jgi:CHAT domain-containing protein
MPFHAAGRHEEGSKQNTFAHVTSSYTPPMRALEFAQSRAKQMAQTLAVHSSMLIVTMPTTPDRPNGKVWPKLPQTVEEKDSILNSIGGRFAVVSLEHPSTAEVLKILKQSSIAHFACHGVSDPINPSESGLVLQRRVGSSTVAEEDLLTVHVGIG